MRELVPVEFQRADLARGQQVFREVDLLFRRADLLLQGTHFLLGCQDVEKRQGSLRHGLFLGLGHGNRDPPLLRQRGLEVGALLAVVERQGCFRLGREQVENVRLFGVVQRNFQPGIRYDGCPGRGHAEPRQLLVGEAFDAHIERNARGELHHSFARQRQSRRAETLLGFRDHAADIRQHARARNHRLRGGFAGFLPGAHHIRVLVSRQRHDLPKRQAADGRRFLGPDVRDAGTQQQHDGCNCVSPGKHGAEHVRKPGRVTSGNPDGAFPVFPSAAAGGSIT